MFVLPFTLDNEYNYNQQCQGASPPDGYLAIFALAHVTLTGVIVLLSRLQLYRLGKLEARGYTKFCQSQRRFVQAPVTAAVAGGLVVYGMRWSKL